MRQFSHIIRSVRQKGMLSRSSRFMPLHFTLCFPSHFAFVVTLSFVFLPPFPSSSSCICFLASPSPPLFLLALFSAFLPLSHPHALLTPLFSLLRIYNHPRR
ncbi:hypothetical protein BV22DRAFT_891904 [Leucogyrophana mollusca]|uniref:Uncharacterized protein n=1 Tax=Leucogyrophana mollusca TaxID=85980 RepID=A0ACB8B069_9AGAM|nr:hypothetical protein BV22DRAFT_891904 [Leucogyrophana mollusca]